MRRRFSLYEIIMIGGIVVGIPLSLWFGLMLGRSGITLKQFFLMSLIFG